MQLPQALRRQPEHVYLVENQHARGSLPARHGALCQLLHQLRDTLVWGRDLPQTTRAEPVQYVNQLGAQMAKYLAEQWKALQGAITDPLCQRLATPSALHL